MKHPVVSPFGDIVMTFHKISSPKAFFLPNRDSPLGMIFDHKEKALEISIEIIRGKIHS